MRKKCRPTRLAALGCCVLLGVTASAALGGESTHLEQVLASTSFPVTVQRVDLVDPPKGDAPAPSVRVQAVEAHSVTSGDGAMGLGFGPWSSVYATGCYLDVEDASRLETVLPTLEAEAAAWTVPGVKHEAFLALRSGIRLGVRSLGNASIEWDFECGGRYSGRVEPEQLKSLLQSGLAQLRAWRQE